METVILVIHLIVASLMVGVILMQRSEGGALGIGGGPGSMMTARGQGNLLTRATTILAGVFMLTSLTLAILAGNTGGSRLEDAVRDGAVPVSLPAGDLPAVPDGDLPAVPGGEAQPVAPANDAGTPSDGAPVDPPAAPE